MSAHRRGDGQLLIAIPLFIMAVAALLVRALPLPPLAGIRLHMPWLMNDFKIIIYCPAFLLVHGGNPYDRELFLAVCPVDQGMPMYLPSAFYLHVPFGLLPLQVSANTYLTLTILLTLVLALVSVRLGGPPVKPGRILLVAGLLLLSRPGQWNALLGQPTLELVLAAYVGLYFARRRPWLSALGLAIAMYKPTIGIPLMALMFVRGDHRAVVLGASLVAAFNLPLIATLANQAGGLRPFMSGVLAGHRTWEASVNPAHSGNSIELAALIGRLAGHRLSTGGWILVGLVVLGVAAAALRRLGHASDAASERFSSSLICIATLLAMHHHAYDLLLLTAPVVALVSRGLPPGLVSPRWRVGLYVLYGVLAMNYLGSNAVLSKVDEESYLWLVLASLNGLALLTVFLVYVSRAAHSPGGRVGPTGWSVARLSHG